MINDYLRTSQTEISRGIRRLPSLSLLTMLDMRAILIDWLVDVADEFKMNRDTVFLCVFYVDRYLSSIKAPIARSKLQLLGVTSLLIAAYHSPTTT